MKFGGSSLASPARIHSVAEKVAAAQVEHGRVAVVVSAMGKTTDELVSLARSVSATPAPRELDVLLSAGERISIALLAMALEARGISAVSMTGRQCGIITEGAHVRARIAEIRADRVMRAMDERRVVVVAGFQGISCDGDVTTLGRGGSDTTAVALAAALGASSCDIYSDVDGVYSADPRLCPRARHLDALDYDTMHELSRQGARVLHVKALEHARRGGVTIRARATFGSPRRTTIGPPALVPGARVSGGDPLAVTARRDLMRIRARDSETAKNVRDELGERVPLYWAEPCGSGETLWAITEELPDPRAFARALETSASGRVEVRTGFGSAALVFSSGFTDSGLIADTLARAGIVAHARCNNPHAAAAIIDASRVDEAVRALHREAIEESEELVSCAS